MDAATTLTAANLHVRRPPKGVATPSRTHMTFGEQIAKLNSRAKLRIAPSKIHGVGIFAVRDIVRGETLYAGHMPEVYTFPYSNFGNLSPEVRKLILDRWPRVIEGSHFIYPDAAMMAYMNHSDDPNYDAELDLAVRDIKTGEEVTENYRKISGYETAFPWLVNKSPKRKRVA